MGAINYKTSDYITLGIKPYDFDECKALELEFYKEEYPELLNADGDIDDNIVYEYIAECYNDDYENIKNELDKYDFVYYHVNIEPGYYDGFTIDIENNFGVAYDDWTDRAEAQKEITQIKQLLTDCAGMGMVECAPGWCTGYSDYKETLKAIESAIKYMRAEVKTIPTWRQYLIDCGEWKKGA